MNTKWNLSWLATAACAAPLIGQAHHGAAAYEKQAPIKLEATITRFHWENPHALIHFNAVDEQGRVVQWTAETAGLVILARAGWHRDSLKPGDRCQVIGFAARNGSPSMILDRLLFPDGRELGSFIP